MKKSYLNKGFTLIELLMVVAIIGILSSVVSVSLNTTKNNSKAAATKKTLSSLKGAVALCCSVQDNSLNPAGAGGDEICSSPMNSFLPTNKELGMTTSATVNYTGSQCNVAEPGFSILIGDHAKSECNGVWSVVENLVTPPPGC